MNKEYLDLLLSFKCALLSKAVIDGIKANAYSKEVGVVDNLLNRYIEEGLIKVDKNATKKQPKIIYTNMFKEGIKQGMRDDLDWYLIIENEWLADNKRGQETQEKLISYLSEESIKHVFYNTPDMDALFKIGDYSFSLNMFTKDYIDKRNKYLFSYKNVEPPKKETEFLTFEGFGLIALYENYHYKFSITDIVKVSSRLIKAIKNGHTKLDKLDFYKYERLKNNSNKKDIKKTAVLYDRLFIPQGKKDYISKLKNVASNDYQNLLRILFDNVTSANYETTLKECKSVLNNIDKGVHNNKYPDVFKEMGFDRYSLTKVIEFLILYKKIIIKDTIFNGYLENVSGEMSADYLQK